MHAWKRFRRRRIRRSVTALTPFLLLYALFTAPQWIHDHRLNGLADRFLNHPLPPETDVADDEVQSSVALRGNGNHCDYRLRFNLRSKLPVSEIESHYESAAIGVEGGKVSVTVWTPSDAPPFPLTFDDRLVIVEVQDILHDPGWDPRCH
ncbi:hypothetical protein [Planobispora longispora]|uniref:Uncharacterized protein n=1 Tax=Planobispora longispora TaxID=28887 RepID=A0A8J3RL94_9ACTN|nr:hypothetical protein [Planobispora longispora]GIH76995.1 hypothetical protein Plo01_34240 [Planobispora longispora]